MQRSSDGTEDESIGFDVVRNHEEQYSIWPNNRELPLGWFKVGKSGNRSECLAYIEEVWTDMRPLSIRTRLHRGTHVGTHVEKNDGSPEDTAAGLQR
ncbi:MbtH family protein [Pendulispora albinea]|uniref:MbtH family NRPS accessory protein n=1 Tax=Pendulispora albinea TaxID=2741071 RepID=A0ABZ2MCG9_9BACT